MWSFYIVDFYLSRMGLERDRHDRRRSPYAYVLTDGII